MDREATRMIYEAGLCTRCGNPRGVCHAERQHSVQFRRRMILQRRESLRVLAGAIAALDAHGTPISEHALASYQRLTRAKRGP